MFRCAASSLIAYPLLRGAIPCVSVAVPIPAVPIHCFVFRCCAIPMLCVATRRDSTLRPGRATHCNSVAPCLLALRILCRARRILACPSLLTAFPMRLLPCFAIPMHFSASPVPAMPELFRANPLPYFATLRHSDATHISAFPLPCLASRCSSNARHSSSFALCCESVPCPGYPLLCQTVQFLRFSMLCQRKTQLLSASALHSKAFPMLNSAVPSLLKSMPPPRAAFRRCATAMHDLSMLHFSSANLFSAHP